MRMCFRFTSDSERAMDIVNNGFLKVFQKIDTFQGSGSLEGWIRRIVYHCISDHFRKESRYLKFVVLDEPEKNSKVTALDDLYYDDIIDMVQLLPEKTRAVFEMYAIEGYTHKEIAERLNMQVGTSKWHLSNARQRLQQILSNRMQQQHAG